MYTDTEVTQQRQHAINMLEAMQREVQNGPHHLYLDQLRTALEENIWVLQRYLDRDRPRDVA